VGEADKTAMSRQFYGKEFRPGKWHVCDRRNGSRPIYGEDDKPCIFDEDKAMDAMENLNSCDEDYDDPENPTGEMPEA
jgi:hypothetical protein